MSRGSERDRRVPRSLRLGLSWWLFCFLLAARAVAQAEPLSAEAVKAAYLHRFAAYVQWPDRPRADSSDPARSNERQPFTIGVYRAGRVADQLQQVLPTLSIAGRPAEVRIVREPKDVEGLEILYVGPGQARPARGLISHARSRPILVVTDETNGLRSGAAINFIQVADTVRFEVSVAAAERCGLSISSALLAVAQRVETTP